MSERIGRMAEESREEGGGAAAEDRQGGGRGDQQENKQEDSRPRNPKKRMWDEDVEARKHEAREEKDEL